MTTVQHVTDAESEAQGVDKEEERGEKDDDIGQVVQNLKVPLPFPQLNVPFLQMESFSHLEWRFFAWSGGNLILWQRVVFLFDLHIEGDVSVCSPFQTEQIIVNVSLGGIPCQKLAPIVIVRAAVVAVGTDLATGQDFVVRKKREDVKPYIW